MPPAVRRPFPTMPASCWWPLRERFKRSMPAVVDTSYLCDVLGVEPKTARNLVPMLREMRLIDAAGKPLDRAYHWRVDGEYPSVCRRIRDEIYPASLRVSVPDPSSDFNGCYHWFLTNTGVGEAAARRMARFYVLLSQAQPLRPATSSGAGRGRPVGEWDQPSPRRTGAHPHGANGHRVARSTERPGDTAIDEAAGEERTVSIGNVDGVVPIVLQLQLTAETTPEQIDQVFASIARHLGKDRVSK